MAQIGAMSISLCILEVVTLDSFFPLLRISAKVIYIVFWKLLTSLIFENSQIFPHTQPNRENGTGG